MVISHLGLATQTAVTDSGTAPTVLLLLGAGQEKPFRGISFEDAEFLSTIQHTGQKVRLPPNLPVTHDLPLPVQAFQFPFCQLRGVVSTNVPCIFKPSLRPGLWVSCDR